MVLRVTSLTQQYLEVSTYSLCKELVQNTKVLVRQTSTAVKITHCFSALNCLNCSTYFPVDYRMGSRLDQLLQPSEHEDRAGEVDEKNMPLRHMDCLEQHSRKRSEDSSSVTSCNLSTHPPTQRNPFHQFYTKQPARCSAAVAKNCSCGKRKDLINAFSSSKN